ncbi:hypothetical protein SMACR_01545 [Sordaria macrospora]|uniref:WGS project CABT00000000 data, contig 2.4 n=2 Tax=Sordaria macrospora TaxID=5147 RepID=F7VR47_SORMK|nr:uncharacterized protein SMAC_01545 [Sordaria macrospora k-hell]KAA8635349.1 hypothetical protein SMACR_01545 [Sordaria macrospora]KAH7634653.1 hypothetical protein B0T09DRAFT_9668 [Sordaria sp. MPI-SDFR-AT-0083]WPJ58567.1 hypothetical protein SMAC4_01545 [Sordaria macrospora]CCC07980.1 unnamed protein product [Sordaria macrospora k-hell]
MQSVLAITISLLSVLSPVLAVPASGEHPALVARTPGNVYVCTGSNWQNTCEVLTLGTSGTCTPLPSAYNGHIGSAGPDAGAICRLFANGDCTGSGLAILTNPGESNLYNYNGGQDAGHAAHYISCRTCTACT